MADDNVIESKGWKGTGKTEISELGDNYYIIRCYAKYKATGESYSTDHKVSKQTVRDLLGIMTMYCVPKEEYGPVWMWRRLVKFYDLGKKENVDEDIITTLFNGGKYRAKYYFPLYYYPMKILEEQGKIIYGERKWQWLGGQ